MTNQPQLYDYLEHIYQAIIDIESDVICPKNGRFIDFAVFGQDKTKQRSVIYSFIIMGEASTKITQKYPEFAQEHSQVAWQAMKGMRNHLAHGYFAINTKIVWNTIEKELPKLKQQIGALLASQQDAQDME